MIFTPPLLASTSSDIPFHGLVETTGDALYLIQAARQGIIPRVARRLNQAERRKMIRSGAVFVFSVQESGIKRWTEGRSWSASRISGNFLQYHELWGRENAPGKAGCQSTSKPGGLIKKTITIIADGTQYHLVSYYNSEDCRTEKLQRPTTHPGIMALGIPSDLLVASKFRYPPTIELSFNGVMNIRDADELVPSPTQDFRQSLLERRPWSPYVQPDVDLQVEPTSFLLHTSRCSRAAGKLHSLYNASADRSTSEAYVASVTSRAEEHPATVATSMSCSIHETTQNSAESGSAYETPEQLLCQDERFDFGTDMNSIMSAGYDNSHALVDHHNFDIRLPSVTRSITQEATSTHGDITQTYSYSSTAPLGLIPHSIQSPYHLSSEEVTYKMLFPQNDEPVAPYPSRNYRFSGNDQTLS